MAKKNRYKTDWIAFPILFGITALVILMSMHGDPAQTLLGWVLAFMFIGAPVLLAMVLFIRLFK